MDDTRTIAEQAAEDWPGFLARALDMPREDVERELANTQARAAAARGEH